MAFDPYQEADLRRDLPRTEPRRVDVGEGNGGLWLPVALLIVLFLGGLFYIYGGHTPAPNASADSGAVTKSEPSPN